MRTLLALLVVVLSLASAASAKDEACTNGQTCFCDCLQNTDGTANDVPTAGCTPDGSTCFSNTTCQTNGTPKAVDTVLLCEDFEGLHMHSLASYGDCTETDAVATGGWRAEYGTPSGSCNNTSFCCGPNGVSGGGDDYLNTCDATNCRAMVFGDELDCDHSAPAGEEDEYTDCIFQGSKTFAHRFVPGQGAGTVGAKTIGTYATFGITVAYKWNGDYMAPQEAVSPANKGDEWTLDGSGGGQRSYFGSNTSNATRSYPFPSTGHCTSTTATLHYGQSVYTNTCITPGTPPPHNFEVGVKPSDWDWRGLNGQAEAVRYYPDHRAEWVCFEMESTGLATSSSRSKVWTTKYGGTRKLMWDLSYDSAGMSGGIYFVWNKYYNKPVGDPCSGDSCYPSAATQTAYRLIDNMVQVNGPPIPCSHLGFGAASPPVTPSIQGSGAYTISALDVDVQETAWTRLLRLWAGAWRGGVH